MNSVSFKKNLLGVQEELLRFAYKLTADREEANDLLQETSLKALDNEDKYIPDTNFKVSIRPRACFFPLFSFLPLWLHYNLNPLCVQY